MDKVEKGIRLVLEGLQEAHDLDIESDNFKETPERVARAYQEIFSGLRDTSVQLDLILKSKFPSGGYDQMIVCSGVVVYSMCPHHLLPVRYEVDLGYIPSKEGSVIGISKLARIIDVLAKRPVLQESMTQDIGKAMNRIDPLGVAVRVKGEHSCMRIRGIRKEGVITTSYLSGVFREEVSTREEFLKLITT